MNAVGGLGSSGAHRCAGHALPELRRDPGVPASESAPVSPQQLVLEFHLTFSLPVRQQPTIPPEAEARLRERILNEEVEELTLAVEAHDLVRVADSLADIVYVTYGTALTYGIDLDLVVAEVHRANMSKLGRDGRRKIRADGKVLKGSHYRPPDVQGVLGLGCDALSPA